jgi:hypothetical protein
VAYEDPSQTQVGRTGLQVWSEEPGSEAGRQRWSARWSLGM